jgi:two-component system, cell cycle sensor histidine kinase and response regulator CckA
MSRSRVSLPSAKTILLVEDEVAVLELLEHILCKNGYAVLLAEQADTAIKLCQQYNGAIDLIITDVLMSTMNGYDLVRCIAQAYPHIPALYISGHPLHNLVRQGIADPQAAFLQKPFSPVALTDKVREMLDISYEA